MSHRHKPSLIVCALLLLAACGDGARPVDCSREWQESVETALGTGDGQGHGPDLGSEEWKSVVEFRLGVRGRGDVPDRDSGDWCAYVQARIDDRRNESN